MGGILITSFESPTTEIEDRQRDWGPNCRKNNEKQVFHRNHKHQSKRSRIPNENRRPWVITGHQNVKRRMYKRQKEKWWIVEIEKENTTVSANLIRITREKPKQNPRY